MRDRFFFIAIIVAAGILTYLCAPLSGFLSIDDMGMVNFISGQTFTLKSLFLGGGSEYFRPLTVISYSANAALCGLNPVGFHLVNIAIHIANALLVYWLALVLFAERESSDWVAAIAALFFLVSPLNSEAVVWVSARTDLLCTFFFLLALLLLVKQRERVSASTLCCLALTYLASLCCKESSIALFGIAPLFLLLRSPREGRNQAVLLTLAVFAATGVYAFLRTGLRFSVDRGAASVISSVTQRAELQKSVVVGKDADYPSLLDALGAYGFYLKKLVQPFPLNFTILDYDRWTAFLSLGLALICALYLLRRYRAALLPLLIVFLGIVPPVLAYIGRIPWTPFGERYLYLPMVGFSLLVAMVLADLRVPRLVPVLCVLLLALPTMARVSLWCDTTAFWNDALKHSPGFAKSYSALAAAAIEEQRWGDAERHIEKARRLGFNEPVILQNLGRVYLAKKEFASYEDVMAKAAARSPRPTPIYEEMIVTMTTAGKSFPPAELRAKTIKYQLLALSRDPSYLEGYYNLGKLYLVDGDKSNAVRYLNLYLERSKDGFNRPFAVKMLARLEG